MALTADESVVHTPRLPAFPRRRFLHRRLDAFISFASISTHRHVRPGLQPRERARFSVIKK